MLIHLLSSLFQVPKGFPSHENEDLVYNVYLRSDSLNSSMTVVTLKKRASHLQARINSAKRKSQTELVNSIAALKIEIQVIVY